MRMGRRGGAAVAGVLLLGGLFAGSAPVRGQTVQLSPEVRAWMERDQVQRWRSMLREGDSIFHARSCVRCHGEGGAGARNGPDLTDTTWVQSDGSLEGIRRTIFWGVKREDFSDSSWRFEMNPGGGADPTWAQYDALASYVWSLSNGTGLPEG